MQTKSLYPIIVVENLEESKKFYCEFMDYSVKHDTVRKDGGHVLVLANPNGFEIELMEMFKEGPVKMNPGIHGFRMNVDDIEEAKKEVEAKGYKIVAGPIDTANGKNLLIEDNSGVGITLIQHI